jgi:hypothetical protein
MEYRIMDSHGGGEHFSLCVIPVKKPTPQIRGLIEVGSDGPNDLKNGFSRYRRVAVLPRTSDSDQWSEITLEFDFRSTPDAASSIIAPRVNEGFLNPRPGTLVVKRVVLRTD